MHKTKKLLSLALCLALALSACLGGMALAEETDAGFAGTLQAMYADPEVEYRPELRWWMAEGSHTDETLLEDIDGMAEDGFGAVEFLAMSVYGSNSSTYGWGSEEWVNDTALIVREATEKGLGFSLTSGTNWGTANLPDTYVYEGERITPDHRATQQQLSYNTATVAAGETLDADILKHDYTDKAVTRQSLQAVVAVGAIDEATLDENDIHVLTAEDYEETEDGIHVHWTAPETNAQYTVFAFWMHGAAETSDPSVSYNYTITYTDPDGVEALIDYWENVVLTDELRALILENGRGEMYMDSLELQTMDGTGGIHWGYTYAEEFEARRGYSIIPYLPFILNTTAGRSSNGLDYLYNNMNDEGWTESETLQKIRTDFFQTNTELYIENVLEPLQSWLHSIGMELRAEISYGGNFLDISQPGKYVDDIETESLEFATQIDSFRNLSGVAHLYGKTFSSETAAVMSGLIESFGDPTAGIYSGSFDRLNQILYTQYAAGISRAVFHTYTSQWAPEEELAAWPGYIGNLDTQWPERMGPRQPVSEHYTEWTAMQGRFQKALRQGLPRVDIGILRTDYALNCNLSGLTYEDDSGFRAGNGLYYDISLQNAGYTYEYFSPVLLTYTDENGEKDIVFEDGVVQPGGPAYQALILYQEQLPLESAEVLLEWASGEDALPVIIVNNVTELGRAYGYGGGEKVTVHEEAASVTLYNNAGETDADAKLAEVMEQLKALPNVVVIDDDTQTVEALKSLGVYPRADFSQSNDTILTNMRLDAENGMLYLYVYNYQPGNTNMLNDTAIGEPFTVELSVDYVGRPYQLNGWTGEVTELAAYTVEDGRTDLAVTLAPGEATLLVFDLNEGAADAPHAVEANAPVVAEDGALTLRAEATGDYAVTLSDGSTVETHVEVQDDIPLDTWDVTIQTWTAGELETRVEEKEEYDHTSTEYRYATNKEDVALGEVTELKAWKDMGVELSGIGTYATTFELPEDWGADNGAVLKLGSIYRASAVVYVNGTRMAMPLESLELDITDALLPGQTNEITVEVATNLQNSVKGETLKEIDALQNYGLVGENSLNIYKTVSLTDAE